MRYDSLIRPILFRMSAETAHEIGINALRIGLSSRTAQKIASKQFESEPFDGVSRFGLRFKNPLGMAAGFDKNGVVVNQLASLGFGFVEVGTVTMQPQKGNPKPRLFRLPDDAALINRLGFNNDGAAVVADRVAKLDKRCIVGVNIGRNKDVPNETAVKNYLDSLDLIHDVADYVAVNISSPNTPNLRELQQGENLNELLQALQERNSLLSAASSSEIVSGAQNKKPLLVKIAPDLDERDIEMIVEVCVRHDVAGIIATNTTVSRENLKTKNVEKIGAGGLSGLPLRQRSNQVIQSVFRYSRGKLPIIGVGGIFTPEDAFEKIASGASLLQAYTGFVYTGPKFARFVNDGLHQILRDKGFATLNDAIGSAVRT